MIRKNTGWVLVGAGDLRRNDAAIAPVVAALRNRQDIPAGWNVRLGLRWSKTWVRLEQEGE